MKFHWSPLAGTHSLVWDEAVKISGADPDFHRRDLWEAIEAGAYPEYELAVQVFTERDADAFSFDVLDATKIVPEELVPLQPIGRMVLNRNPDNFFAETEQVAFCTAHIVPGIDFTNDPLLAGRIHSYVDTQISRLGGPNFHEIPINAPVAQVHNNQRDGMHRQAITRGRVAYEPNSLGGGCPFQAGRRASCRSPSESRSDKVRGKPEKFAEHYNQATLFWNSQSAGGEGAHRRTRSASSSRRCRRSAVRERVVAGLRNVADELAEAVADGLGLQLPEPLPKVLARTLRPEVRESPALSLFARPGDGASERGASRSSSPTGWTATRYAPAPALASAARCHDSSARSSARSESAGGDPIDVEISIEAAPGGRVRRAGAAGWEARGQDARPTRSSDGIREGHVSALQADTRARRSGALLESAGIPDTARAASLIPVYSTSRTGREQALAALIAALAKHRHYERETRPPRV